MRKAIQNLLDILLPARFWKKLVQTQDDLIKNLEKIIECQDEQIKLYKEIVLIYKLKEELEESKTS